MSVRSQSAAAPSAAPGSPRSVPSFLSAESLEPDHGLGRTPVCGMFKSAAVEADFVLFLHRSRMPLLLVCGFELAVMAFTAPPVVSGYPKAIDYVTAGCFCAIALVAVLLTDVVTEQLKRHCVRWTLAPQTRAFAHEVLLCVAFTVAMRIVVRVAFVEPPPECTRNDGRRICNMISFVDHGKLMLYAVLCPLRRVALFCILPLIFVFTTIVQVENIFGPAAATFYEVSDSEVLGRIVITLLSCFTATIVVCAREPRIREHFLTAVAVAMTEQHRAEMQRQVRALQWVTGAQAPSAPKTSVLASSPRLDFGLAVGSWMDLILIGDSGHTRMGLRRPVGQHLLQFATHSVASDHAALLHGILCSVPRYDRVQQVGAIGDSIWATGALRHAFGSDAALSADALALCAFSMKLATAARRTALINATWANTVALSGAVAVSGASQHESTAGVSPQSQVVTSARNNLRRTAVQAWKVCAVAEVMALVEPHFVSDNVTTVDGVPVFHLFGDFDEQLMEPDVLTTARCAPDEPHTLADAIDALQATLAYVAPGQMDDEGLEHEFATRVVSCVCGFRESAICKQLFPVFEDENTEAEFVELDNAGVLPSFRAHGAICFLVIVAFTALLAGSRHMSARIGVVCFVAAVGSAIVTLFAACCLKRVSTQLRVALITVQCIFTYGVAALCLAFEPHSQAARDAFIVLTPVLLSATTLMPQHPLVRYVMIVAISAVLVIILSSFHTPGHDDDVAVAWIGLIPALFLSYIVTKAAREQFADVRKLEAEQLRDQRAEVLATEALRERMPPLVADSLRTAIDHPLHAAIEATRAIALYIEVDDAALERTARFHVGVKTRGAPEGSPGFEHAVAEHRCLFEAQLRRHIDGGVVGRFDKWQSERHVATYGDGILVVDLGVSAREQDSRNTPSVRSGLLWQLAVGFWQTAATTLLAQPVDADPMDASINSKESLAGTGDSMTRHEPSTVPPVVRVAMHTGTIYASLVGRAPRSLCLFGEPVSMLPHLARAATSSRPAVIAAAVPGLVFDGDSVVEVLGLRAHAVNLFHGSDASHAAIDRTLVSPRRAAPALLSSNPPPPTMRRALSLDFTALDAQHTQRLEAMRRDRDAFPESPQVRPSPE